MRDAMRAPTTAHEKLTKSDEYITINNNRLGFSSNSYRCSQWKKYFVLKALVYMHVCKFKFRSSTTRRRFTCNNWLKLQDALVCQIWFQVHHASSHTPATAIAIIITNSGGLRQLSRFWKWTAYSQNFIANHHKSRMKELSILPTWWSMWFSATTVS